MGMSGSGIINTDKHIMENYYVYQSLPIMRQRN